MHHRRRLASKGLLLALALGLIGSLVGCCGNELPADGAQAAADAAELRD